MPLSKSQKRRHHTLSTWWCPFIVQKLPECMTSLHVVAWLDSEPIDTIHKGQSSSLSLIQVWVLLTFSEILISLNFNRYWKNYVLAKNISCRTQIFFKIFSKKFKYLIEFKRIFWWFGWSANRNHWISMISVGAKNFLKLKLKNLCDRASKDQPAQDKSKMRP